MVLPFLAAAAPFAPLIGAGISALGSLFAPKPKPQTVKHSIDIKKLRDDAEAAGFNPLTIIRGGGLAGYGSSVASAVPDMRLSNALMTFGSGVAQWQYDPYGQQKSLTELKLAEAQLQGFARAGSAPSNMSFRTPKASGTDDRYTAFGVDWKRSEWFDDAQIIEDRHGDLAGSVYGFLSGPADFFTTARDDNWLGWQQWGGQFAARAAEGAARRERLHQQFSPWSDTNKPISITVRGGAH